MVDLSVNHTWQIPSSGEIAGLLSFLGFCFTSKPWPTNGFWNQWHGGRPCALVHVPLQTWSWFWPSESCISVTLAAHSAWQLLFVFHLGELESCGLFWLAYWALLPRFPCGSSAVLSPHKMVESRISIISVFEAARYCIKLPVWLLKIHIFVTKSLSFCLF